MRFPSRLKVNIVLSFIIIFFLSLALFVSAKSRAQAIGQTDWPMFGFDAQHTHYNPNENVLNPTNVSGLTLDWRLPYGSSDSSPTVVNGVIYVGSTDGKLYAIDATTHILQWSSTTVGSLDSSTPAVANGVVYVGSQDHNLYAFTASGCGSTSCPPVWSYTTSGVIYSSPVVVNGLVYFGSDDGNLYVLDATSGTLKWSYTTGGPIQSSPAVDNGVVYVGSQDHNLYAFTASGCGSTSCPPVWSYTTGGLVTFSSPAVANGVVYVGSTDHILYAIDATTHMLKWSYQTSGFIRSSPAVANGIVYLGSWDDNLYAIDAMTGALIWYHSTGTVFDSSPSVANGVVYIGSADNNLYAFNATGCGSTLCPPIWSYPTGSIYLSSPSVVNGVVYVDSGNLYAFSLPGVTPTPSPSPSPSPTPPGGTWITPDNNFAIQGNSLHFAAHAYPTNQGGSAISRVNFTAWWPGVDPNNWYIPCTLSTPTPGTTDVYECDWNLKDQNGNPIPNGQLEVSFNVYDVAGNSNLAPNGIHQGTITYIVTVNYNSYAGYAVTGSQTQPVTYTDVQGSWIVPSVQSCTLLKESQSTFWVGLGGFPNGNGIEQIATISRCIGPLHRYEVAYEMLPARPVVIDFLKYPVSPGDNIKAEVRYIGNNKFTFTMKDSTKGWNFSTTQKQTQKNVALNSAEWITEAVPSQSGKQLKPLLDFGTVNFSNCYDNGNSSSPGNPISFGPTIYQSDMLISASDHTPKALPSNLTSNGTAFSVEWKHS